jgi:tetraacyldisaccharide 4'-kinase
MLIDGNLRFGNKKLLPQGPLREPLDEVKRADIILIMNKRALDKDATQNCENFAKEISDKYGKKTTVCNFAPVGIYLFSENADMPSQLCVPEKVYAFAGIGQPRFFFEYLENQGYEVLKQRVFEDHHLYTKEDIKNILAEAKKLGAKAIVTTEKDAVKIKALIETGELGFFALKLGLDLDIKSIVEE